MSGTVSRAEILERVEAAGVVGAGGGGFPTSEKLRVQADIDTVVVNGAECEPLLQSDKFLIEHEYGRLIRGLEYMLVCTGASRGYIAVKEKHAGPHTNLARVLQGREDIVTFSLGDYYPAGDEFVLVHEVTGRIVPEGGIPPDVGCLVDNVETVINICRAVEEGKPVTSRFLTCTGEVRSPAVVRAQVGCSIGDIVELCGGSGVDDPVAVLGGPMMGSVVTDFETPVTKTTSGILVLSRDHDLVRKKTTPMEFIVKQCRSVCCQCTYCTDLCPRHLLGYDLAPHLIMRQIGYGLDMPARAITNAVLCSGCGLCAVYACTMGLQPHLVNLRIRDRLRSEDYGPIFAEREIRVHEMKEYRKIPTSRIIERLQLSRYGERRLKTGLQTDAVRVEILLGQHAGSPSKPLVGAGDRVAAGEVIANPPADGPGLGPGSGSYIHASIDGRVALVDDERVILERRG